MRKNNLKAIVIALFALPLLALTFSSASAVSGTAVTDDDYAAMFKTKCQACHTAKAEKYFDLAKDDAHHVKAIMEGQKGEKPPYMPAFEPKGMTKEQATALVAYMRTLRAPAN